MRIVRSERIRPIKSVESEEALQRRSDYKGAEGRIRLKGDGG